MLLRTAANIEKINDIILKESRVNSVICIFQNNFSGRNSKDFSYELMQTLVFKINAHTQIYPKIQVIINANNFFVSSDSNFYNKFLSGCSFF